VVSLKTGLDAFDGLTIGDNRFLCVTDGLLDILLSVGVFCETIKDVGDSGEAAMIEIAVTFGGSRERISLVTETGSDVVVFGEFGSVVQEFGGGRETFVCHG